ncbi:MAG TPA: hypothetical protein VII47_16620 [Actinomycetota bacterium]|jgi:hypothetical protein
MAITPIYGSRPNAAGWQRATTFHPYDDMGLNPSDAMEKNTRSISGGSERARSAAGGASKQQAYKSVGSVGVVGGQARSPYQR